jgi:hypothetical protein
MVTLLTLACVPAAGAVAAVQSDEELLLLEAIDIYGEAASAMAAAAEAASAGTAGQQAMQEQNLKQQ